MAKDKVFFRKTPGIAAETHSKVDEILNVAVLSKTNSLRTLFITGNVPYPPMGGASLRNWQNINIMMKFGTVAVFCMPTFSHESNYNAESPPGIAIWSVNHATDKQPSLGEKVQRRLQQLWWLLTRGHPYTGAGNYCTYSLVQELNRILTKFQPDLVVFEEPWLCGYLPVVKRHQCRVILDAHNAETFLFREIYYKVKEVKGFKAKVKTSIELARIEAIERDFVRRVYQVWACSDRDASLLQEVAGKVLRTHVVPNGVDIAYYDSVRQGHYSHSSGLEPIPWTLMFPAKFSYKPNALAAQLLLEQIYPRLQQFYPDCRLLLVGVDPTQLMLEAAKQDRRIVVTGKVPDIRPYLAASSVVVVPLLDGGGTRLKILEAMAAGRPVVSTSKGAEGLSVRDGEHLLIGDNPDALVAGVCKIWSDASQAQKLADSAYELVRKDYSWEAVSQRVEQAVRELL